MPPKLGDIFFGNDFSKLVSLMSDEVARKVTAPCVLELHAIAQSIQSARQGPRVVTIPCHGADGTLEEVTALFSYAEEGYSLSCHHLAKGSQACILYSSQKSIDLVCTTTPGYHGECPYIQKTYPF